MNLKKLTKRQIEVLNFIKSEFNKKGYPPTVREICKAIGLSSTSTVHGHLTRLVKKGYLTKEDYKPRSLSSLKIQDSDIMNTLNESYINIPVIKNIMVKAPILAIENIERRFPIPRNFIESGSYFLLKSQNKNMVAVGILDKDYVLVKQQYSAENGEIIVTLIDKVLTMKKFLKNKDDTNILGIVKGVFRKL